MSAQPVLDGKKNGSVKAKSAPPPLAKDLTSAEKHRILLSVPCPQCEREAGQRCRTPNGHATAIAHRARYEAASKTGLIAW